jgi:hypothetical protein
MKLRNEFVNWDLNNHKKQCMLHVSVFGLKMTHVGRNMLLNKHQNLIDGYNSSSQKVNAVPLS